MQRAFFLTLAVVLAGGAVSAAGAQSIPLAGIASSAGPNARAAQRPLGPNGRVAVRTPGPNAAVVRAARPKEEAYYPNCAAAGAVRALPVRQGEPGYGRHLDRKERGAACE